LKHLLRRTEEELPILLRKATGPNADHPPLCTQPKATAAKVDRIDCIPRHVLPPSVGKNCNSALIQATHTPSRKSKGDKQAGSCGNEKTLDDNDIGERLRRIQHEPQ